MSRLTEKLKRTEHPALRLMLLRSRSAPHMLTRGHLVRRRLTSRYLQTVAEPRLQIGAGPLSREEWLSSDLISGDIYLDLTRRLALPDNSFSYAFGEHVIEHVSESRGRRLLADLHRILRTGGVLRLVTPDMRKILALYEDESPVISRADYMAFLDRETGKRHERPAQMLNDYLRLWGHLYVYDEEDLTAKLYEAGFAKVERVEPGESRHPMLRGLERHGGAEWINRAEAMVLEATR